MALALIVTVLPAAVAGAQTFPVVSIPEIQGDGLFSPLEGQIVTTSGIVTAVSANGRDMWIQDPVGDGNPATSDGIFVDDRDRLDSQPQVGDEVIITGDVEDLQFGNALPLTRLDDPDDFEPYEIVSSGNPLPAPVVINDLPDESIAAAIEFWAALEGMRVAVANGRVVGATNRFGEFVMLTKDDAKPGSGYFPQTKQILLRSLGPNEVDYNPERVMADDSTLATPIQARPGDVVRSLVGVVDYTFGNYKIQPTEFDVERHNLPKPPASKRSGPNGNAVITSYNVENLFDLELNTPVVIDSFGQIGDNPGSSGWGGITANNTLERKDSVCLGDPDPFDAFDPNVEWNSLGNNNFAGLGFHAVTCGSTDSLILSEYVEGSSFNKALEIYNGTGAPVNLASANVTVQIFFNGNTSAGQTISLSGTIANGDVFVLANPSADQAILDVTDQTSGGVLWNGNDAITLNIGGKDDAGSTPTPEALETQLTKLAAAIEVELELPPIMVLQEVENTAIAQELGDRVNASAGTAYTAVSFETSDGRGIEVAFLYDANRATLVDAFQLSGADVEAAFGPDSASPGREPLYGEFLINGETVYIVGNHFKSKGGDDPIFGIASAAGLPFDRITEVQRKLQARVVRDFVNTILDENPDALVMVTGDLNDFEFGEPGEGPDDPLSILEGGTGEVPLTNLVFLEKDAERFSFVFDGNSQVLDHMLVSPTLLDATQAADFLHFDASFEDELGADPTTTLRASDHDALEGRFNLGG
jgi:predicted extracellular nuclease